MSISVVLVTSWACGGDSTPASVDGAPAGDATLSDGPTVDGSGLDATPPSPGCGDLGGVCLIFPLPTTVTTSDTITVRGTADTTTAVAAIRVAGVTARTSDGFANWQADVPIAVGANDIVIEREDATGTIQPMAARVSVMRSPQLTGTFSAMVMDAAGDRAFAFDRPSRSFVEIELSTGVQRHIAGPIAAFDVRDIALDGPGNRLLVLEWFPEGLTSVDIATGARTVISDETTGAGPALSSLSRLAFDAAANRALVSLFVLGGTNALLSVDLATGDRRVLSDANTGTGQPFAGLGDIVFDTARNRVLVAEPKEERIRSVDLTTGDRAVFSDASTGTGAPLFEPLALTLDAVNNRLFVADLSRDYGGSLRALDLDTGDRTTLSFRFAGPPFFPPPTMAEIGRGLALYRTFDIDWHPALDRVVVGANRRYLLNDVDVATGHRTPLWGPNADTPAMLLLSSAVMESANSAFVAGGAELARLDLTTGRHSLIADNAIGAGRDFLNIQSITRNDASDRVIVADWEDVGEYDTEWALLDVDTATGSRANLSPGSICLGQLPSVTYYGNTIYGLSRCEYDTCSQRGVFASDHNTGMLSFVSRVDTCSTGTVGTGPAFQHSMESIAIDKERERALIVQARSVLAVDLVTGQRSVLSDENSSGPPMTEATSLEIDSAHRRAIVVDRHHDAMFAIDLDTGERTLISGETLGKGPDFVYPVSVTLLHHTQLALVSDGDFGLLVVDLVTGERAQMRR